MVTGERWRTWTPDAPPCATCAAPTGRCCSPGSASDGPLSRHELGQRTALSPASVSNLVGELIDEGLVEEAGSVESDGGRPRVLLRVAPGYGYVVGVDVGETRVRVELFDLAMTALAKAEYPIDAAEPRPAAGGRPPPARARRGDRAGRRRPGARCSASASPSPASSSGRRRRRARADPRLGRRAARRDAARRHRPPAAHRQRRQDPRPGRDVVRRRPRRPARGHRPGRLRRRRRRGRRRRQLPRRAQQRRRVGPHHDRVRRAPLPLRRARLPGGVRRGRGGPRPVPAGQPRPRRRPAATRRPPSARCSPPPTRRTRGEGARRDGRLPRRRASRTLVNLFNPERIVLGGWAGLALGERYLPQIREAAARHALRQPYAQTSIELCQLGPDAVALGAATLPMAAAAARRRRAAATPAAARVTPAPPRPTPPAPLARPLNRRAGGGSAAGPTPAQARQGPLLVGAAGAGPDLQPACRRRSCCR